MPCWTFTPEEQQVVDAAGVGSRAVNTFDLSVDLVREGDDWLIDQPAGDKVDAC